MHPLICQFVGFQEAEVQPFPDGGANVLLNLKSRAHEQFGAVTSHWKKEGDFFLSSASVTLKDVPRESEPCEL